MTRLNLFVLFLFALASVLFYAFPMIDITFSNFFFSQERGFSQDLLWVKIGGKMPDFLIPATILFVLGWFFFRYREQHSFSVEAYQDILFFSVATLFSALLLVWCFKLGFGRIRPREIMEFNGFEHFTPAFVINFDTPRGVSFVSGHAATGFMFIAAAFLYQGKKRATLLALSLLLGCYIGLSRIAAGRHFLSDTVTAGFLVYFGTVFIHSKLVKNAPDQ